MLKPFAIIEYSKTFRTFFIYAAIVGGVALASKAEITIRIDYLNIPLEVMPDDEAQTTEDLKV